MIRIATKAAKKSTFQHKIGSVIINKHRILGVGFNKINRYTNKWQQKHPGSLHAEESAILDALSKHSYDKLIGSTIYVSRLAKSGKLALAMPCKNCQRILQAFHIKTCFYSTETGMEKLELT